MAFKSNIDQYWVSVCYLNLNDGHDGVVRVECGENQSYIGYRFSRGSFDAGLGNSKITGAEKLLLPLRNTGVYFLIYRNGKGDISKIYVGKAGERANESLGVMNRIKEHTRDKYKDWNEAIVLTWRENNLNATKVSFLEHEFHEELKRLLGEKMLANDSTPSRSRPDDRELYVLGRFVTFHAPRLISALGYSFFEEKKKRTRKVVKKVTSPKVEISKESVCTADEGAWRSKTELARLIARRAGNEGAKNGVAQYFAPVGSKVRKPCHQDSKWRTPLENAGVKFDKDDFVIDWTCARNPL